MLRSFFAYNQNAIVKVPSTTWIKINHNNINVIMRDSYHPKIAPRKISVGCWSRNFESNSTFVLIVDAILQTSMTMGFTSTS